MEETLLVVPDTAFGPVLAALISGTVLLVSGLLAYHLGKRASRHERLEERQAEVLARLSELLYEVERGYLTSTSPFGHVGEDRKAKIETVAKKHDELYGYYHSHSIWLDPVSCESIEAFLGTVWGMFNDYVDDLDERGYPSSAAGRAVAGKVGRVVPILREGLGIQFRAILRPRPWWRRIFGFD